MEAEAEADRSQILKKKKKKKKKTDVKTTFKDVGTRRAKEEIQKLSSF
jgi:ATP-dependent Zn protease